MTLAEVKRRREETLARERSLRRHFEREVEENREYLEWLQGQCPHDDNAVVCGACGALIDRNKTSSVE